LLGAGSCECISTMHKVWKTNLKKDQIANMRLIAEK
jgi:hypothetical protein